LSGIEHYLNDAAMELLTTEVHQILTRTSGYLRGISSHSLQPYRGCALGNSLCGIGCYVRHNIYVTRGRAWGSFVEVRHGAAAAYLATVRRERDWAHKACGRFGIFMSSSTEPFQPIERRAGVTRQLLEAMLSKNSDTADAKHSAPDELIIQTHSHRVTDYLELYRALDRVTSLRFHVTIESDRDSLPGLPPSASTVSRRFAAASALRDAGLRVVITVAPLLPIERPREFFQRVSACADAVVIDHFIGGDGAPRDDGARTRRTALPQAMAAVDPRSVTLAYRDDIVRLACQIMPGRVGIGRDGFGGKMIVASVGSLPGSGERFATARGFPLTAGTRGLCSGQPSRPFESTRA
jgi:DNA repair photolyase